MSTPTMYLNHVINVGGHLCEERVAYHLNPAGKQWDAVDHTSGRSYRGDTPQRAIAKMLQSRKHNGIAIVGVDGLTSRYCR